MNVKYRGDKEAADLIVSAIWISRWLPTRGVSLWLFKKMVPSSCRNDFQEKADAFKNLPRHVSTEAISRLRGGGKP